MKRRDKKLYPALDPNYNLKSRTEEIKDLLEYAHKLTDKEKAWLNSFAEEYINANFKHKGKKLMRTNKEKRERYRANNSRNNDVYSRAVAGNQLNFIEDIKNELKLDQVVDESNNEESE